MEHNAYLLYEHGLKSKDDVSPFTDISLPLHHILYAVRQSGEEIVARNAKTSSFKYGILCKKTLVNTCSARANRYSFKKRFPFRLILILFPHRLLPLFLIRITILLLANL